MVAGNGLFARRCDSQGGAVPSSFGFRQCRQQPASKEGTQRSILFPYYPCDLRARIRERRMGRTRLTLLASSPHPTESVACGDRHQDIREAVSKPVDTDIPCLEEPCAEVECPTQVVCKLSVSRPSRDLPRAAHSLTQHPTP